MPPAQELVKELDEKFVDLIGKFVSDIKNGKLRGSDNVALAMLTVLETIISESQHATPYELCGAVRAAGRRVASAAPHAPAAANVARRVLRAIRDETRAAANQSGESSGESLQRLVLAAGARRTTLPTGQDLREPLRDHLAELRVELEGSAAAVAVSCRAHVHAGELLLAHGDGGERALRHAVTRRYRLLLAEGASVRESHEAAARLSAAGVPVTVVSAAAVCAVMSRVNKVVLGVYAALGGGAALAPAGALAVAQAAKHYSVPVLALAPLHALSPQHAGESAREHAPHAPAAALDYRRHEVTAAHVYAPQYDVVPPDHITLFITNLGASSPSYMYRLLSELYDPSDYTL